LTDLAAKNNVFFIASAQKPDFFRVAFQFLRNFKKNWKKGWQRNGLWIYVL